MIDEPCTPAQIWAIINKVMDRRDSLFENAPLCPACNTNQVQLTKGSVVSAEWKCRKCRVKFQYEPRVEE